MTNVFKKIKKILFGNEERGKISLNIYWLILEKSIQYTLGFFVSVWVVRYLGPEKYGIFSYAAAFIGLIGSFIGLGLYDIVIRELVKKTDPVESILSTSFAIMLMASIFFLVLSLALVCFLRPEDYQSIYLVAILSVTYLFKPFRVIGFYFESKIESKRTVPYHIIGLLVSSILKIYCILIQSSLYAFAWVTVAEGLVSTIGLLHVYHQNRSNLSISWFSPKWALAKTLLKDSLPFMLSSVMIAIYMKIDQIMLREMVSAKEVGFYSVAVTLTSVWYIIPIAITNSFFPKMVASLQLDELILENQLDRLYRLVGFIGYAIAIPISLLSDHIVILIYGPSFISTGTMLSLLVWVVFFIGFGVVRGAYIRMMNFTKINLSLTAIGAILNIILNIVLIPIYQGLGAVIATLVAQIFACCISSFLFKPLHKNGLMMLKAMVRPTIFKL